MKKIVTLTESDLVRIVKKVLNEQGVIGTLGGRTPIPQQRFNLSKNVPGGRAPSPHTLDDITGPDDTCYIENIHNLVNKCKQNEYKYVPDSDAKFIAKQLFDKMNGVSFGEAIKTLEYLQNDNAAKFCRVSNAFNYNNENLVQWIQDEFSLPRKTVWDTIKKHANELNLGDKCFKGA